MYFLGLNIGKVDPSACLFSTSELITFVEEERFTRKKKGINQFPINSISYCLAKLKNGIEDIDKIVLGYDHNKFTNEVPQYFISEWMKYPLKSQKNGNYELNRLREKHPEDVKNLIKEELNSLGIPNSKIPTIVWHEHHYCHALPAHISSPFKESLGIAIDANGEVENLTVWDCKGIKIKKIYSKGLPTSLGWYYRAFTLFCGFDAYEGEGMLMGLAPYGRSNPEIAAKIEKILFWYDDENGNFEFDVDPEYTYIGEESKLREGLTKKFTALFGKPAKDAENPEQYYRDIAFEAQNRLEKTLLKFVERFLKSTGHVNLTLSGGVALNCKATGYIWKNTKLLNDVYVIPFASDAGIGVGACLSYLVENHPKRLKKFDLKNGYLGPEYSNDQIDCALSCFELQQSFKNEHQYSSIAKKLSISEIGLKEKLVNSDLNILAKQFLKTYAQVANRDNIIEISAKLLSEGKILAWFQGAMEAGPRALGNRSILADPRTMKSLNRVNEKVKFRQSWRPFCPSVLSEFKDEYFLKTTQSQYMINTFDVSEKTELKAPAIVHVDKTARPQFLESGQNKMFFDLLTEFHRISSIPILLNTSMNIKGEPMCMSPIDALNFYFATDVDALVIGDRIIFKE